MGLSWLKKNLPDGHEALVEKVESMSALVDATVQTVQRISAGLRPGVLDDFGLAAAIEWQAEEFQKRTGMQCSVTVEPEDIAVDPDLSTTLFRIFQEALTNIVRHAEATRADASLRERDGEIVLSVQDNGRGIAESQISDVKSLGIIGMRERLRAWKGTLEIKGIRGKGTTVLVSVPLGRKGAP
jgi:signal transduction histidine kinase